jgi:hypothetical protein
MSFTWPWFENMTCISVYALPHIALLNIVNLSTNWTWNTAIQLTNFSFRRRDAFWTFTYTAPGAALTWGRRSLKIVIYICLHNRNAHFQSSHEDCVKWKSIEIHSLRVKNTVIHEKNLLRMNKDWDVLQLFLVWVLGNSVFDYPPRCCE